MSKLYTLPPSFRKLIVSVFFLMVAGPLFASGLKGVYTIDPGSKASTTNYTSFSDAAEDLISGTRTLSGGTAAGPGVTGAVIFKVSSGTYNEQVQFTAITGSSATNTITFISTAGDSSKVILTDASTHSSSANYTLDLSGATYMVFNKITIQSGSTGTYSAVVQLDNLANYNTFSHCQILGVPYTSASNYGALVWTGSSYSQANYNTFNSNYMRRGSAGFYFNSNPTTQANFSVGNNFLNNTIDSVYYAGIYLSSCDSSICKGNIINVKGYYSGFGISDNNQYGFFGTLFCTGQFSNNKIYMPDGGYGLYLNYITGGSSYNDTVSNNFISVGGASQYGIYAFFCDYINFYYNNVLLYGKAGISTSTPSALFVANFGTINSCDVYNNNLVNLRSGTAYTIYGWSNTSKSIKNEDYDNLYAPNSSVLVNYYYKNYKDLADWKTNPFGLATKDTSVNPYYHSNKDLHVDNIVLNGAATPITGITTDIDGQLRNTKTPDIGADEFSPVGNDAGVLSIDSPAAGFCAGSHDVYARVLNFGLNTLTSVNVSWSVNGTPMTAVSWTGSLASGGSAVVKLGTVSFTNGVFKTIKAYSASPNGVTDSNNTNDTSSADLIPGLTGKYLISATSGSADYTSIALAAADLNKKGVCGAVTMNIDDGTYNEHVSINYIAGASNSKRILFQSKSLDSTKVLIDTAYTFTGTQTATITLNGASFITFRKLSITTGASTGFDFYKNVFLMSGGSVYDSFYDNVLTGAPAPNNLNSAIIYSPSDVDSNTVIINNIMKGGYYAAQLMGNQGATFGQGTETGDVIANNIMDSASQGGVYLQYTKGPIVHDNIISDIQYNNYGGTFGGVYMYSNSGPGSIYNNKISLPKGGTGIYMIYNYGTINDSFKVYNNFVSISGTSSPLYSSGSFGIYASQSYFTLFAFNSINITNTSTTAGLETQYYGNDSFAVVDNILSNTGGGPAIAYLNTPPATSDYNDLYVPKGNNIGSYAGAAELTLGDWQTASSLDANSIDVNPLFKSVTDLHAQNTNLQSGSAIGISKDIDGDKRHSIPDMGADEFVPVGNDAGIVALDSPLTPFCAGTRDIYVRVNNFGSNAISSVNVNYSINGGKVVTLSFSFSPAIAVKKDAMVKLASVAFKAGSTQNLVTYTSSPNGTSDGNNNNDSFSTSLTPAMSGTYRVGSSAKADFPNFRAAAAALNAGGICGPTTINVEDGYYNESVNLGAIRGTSNINQLTFQSLSLDSTKVQLDTAGGGSSSSSMNATLSLSGSKWVTIRKMTITQSTSGYSNYDPAIFLHNGASNNTITDNILDGSNGSSYSYMHSGVYFSADPNNANMILNNHIKNFGEGVFIDLNSSYSGGNSVSYNFIDSCYDYGIKSWFTDSFIATHNTITNISSSYGYGIDLYFDRYGFEVTKNKIDMPNGGYGIHADFDNVNGTYSQPADISNNFVSVGGSNQSNGIFGQYTNGLTVYFNSVNMYNTDSNSAAGNFQSVGGFKINHDVQDNIFSDSIGYAIYTDGAGYPSGDYNDLYSPHDVGNYNGTICKTLSDWQTASSQDANSISCYPGFASNTDLHASGACAYGKGTPLAAITDDIDGQIRSTKTPTIGADEYSLTGGDIGAIAIIAPVGGNCGSASTIVGVKVHNYGKVDESGYSVTVKIGGSATATGTATATKTLVAGGADDTLYVSFPSVNTTAGATLKVTAYTSLKGDVDMTNDTTTLSITLLQAPTAKFTATNACAGTAVKVTNSSSVASTATVNYQYYLLNSSGKKVDSSTTASPSFTVPAAGSYRITQHVQYSSGSGCMDTSSSAVQVFANPTARFGHTHICVNDTINFTDSSLTGGGTLTYNWRFGNGAVSTAQNPVNVYKVANTYTVVLKVTNTNGCSDSTSRSINIDSTNAHFTHLIPAADGKVYFKAADSTNNTNFVWMYGDTSTNGGGASNVHKYKASGKYGVTLTATNKNNCVASVTDSFQLTITGIETANAAAFGLNVYPNPFREAASISYTLDKAASVKIELTDLLGRNLATIVDARQDAGSHQAAVNITNAGSNASGIYILKFTIGDKKFTYRLVETK